MKRIIIIIAVCMLLSSLAGCGNAMKENEEFAAWTSNLSGKGFLTEQGYYFVRDDAGYSMTLKQEKQYPSVIKRNATIEGLIFSQGKNRHVMLRLLALKL